MSKKSLPKKIVAKKTAKQPAIKNQSKTPNKVTPETAKFLSDALPRDVQSAWTRLDQNQHDLGFHRNRMDGLEQRIEALEKIDAAVTELGSVSVPFSGTIDTGEPVRFYTSSDVNEAKRDGYITDIEQQFLIRKNLGLEKEPRYVHGKDAVFSSGGKVIGGFSILNTGRAEITSYLGQDNKFDNIQEVFAWLQLAVDSMTYKPEVRDTQEFHDGITGHLMSDGSIKFTGGKFGKFMDFIDWLQKPLPENAIENDGSVTVEPND